MNIQKRFVAFYVVLPVPRTCMHCTGHLFFVTNSLAYVMLTAKHLLAAFWMCMTEHPALTCLFIGKHSVIDRGLPSTIIQKLSISARLDSEKTLKPLSYTVPYVVIKFLKETFSKGSFEFPEGLCYFIDSGRFGRDITTAACTIQYWH